MEAAWAFGRMLRSTSRRRPSPPVHNVIDQLLSSNSRLQAVATLLVLTHGIAGYWAWRRGDLIPVLALNAAFAAIVLIYRAPGLPMAITAQDTAVLVLLAVEALAFTGSVAALCGWAMPRGLVRLVFAAHTLISVALVVFAFTFRITRLI
jgi:hypothetical protein